MIFFSVIFSLLSISYAVSFADEKKSSIDPAFSSTLILQTP